MSAFREWQLIALALLAATLVACQGAAEVQEAETAADPPTGGLPWPAPSDPLDSKQLPSIAAERQAVGHLR